MLVSTPSMLPVLPSRRLEPRSHLPIDQQLRQQLLRWARTWETIGLKCDCALQPRVR
jgi:hypothetical protein